VSHPVSEWRRLREQAVIFEDQAVLALNKPAGISVMGERHDTDLVRLAAAAGEELFPVHRIDKGTSGLVLFAKELRWHGGLTRQFAKRTTGKAYLAIVRPAGLPPRGVLDLPLTPGRKSTVRVAAPRGMIRAAPYAVMPAARDARSADRPAMPSTGPAARTGDGPATPTVGPTAHEEALTWAVPRGAVFSDRRVYPSVTEFAVLWQDRQHALLVVWPLTGRRHQIRVHLAWIGHPIEGDPLFGKADQPRTLLHSWRLAFDAAWRDDSGGLTVEAPPPDDFWAPLMQAIPEIGQETLLGRARSAGSLTHGPAHRGGAR
jgi:tRNA pseudouridine32 synthase/23S rRNA pseudouridine746 synthase